MYKACILLSLLLLSSCGQAQPWGGLASLSVEEVYKNKCAESLARLSVSGRKFNEAEMCLSEINYQDTHGLTALFWPIRHHNYDGVVALLDAGARPNIMLKDNYSEQNYLTFAIYSEQRQVLHALLEAGYFPAGYKDLGYRAAQASILMEDIDALHELLRYGLNPNIQNSLGFSVMHYAAAARNFKAARVLWEAGADPYLVAGDLRTSAWSVLEKPACAADEECGALYQEVIRAERK